MLDNIKQPVETKQGRGQLTQRIKDKSKELFGYELTVRQLRLIPYILNVMQNDKTIDRRRINDEEFDIIIQWENENHLTYSVASCELTITKDFWDKANEILFLGYVDLIK